MANIKSAKKRVEVIETKTAINVAKKSALKTAIKKYKSKPSAEGLSEVVSLLDKAAQDNVIHANKANRLKAQLSKLVA
jgi:small subunit ribosomal protein S20